MRFQHLFILNTSIIPYQTAVKDLKDMWPVTDQIIKYFLGEISSMLY